MEIKVENMKNPPDKMRLMFEAVSELIRQQRDISTIKVQDITAEAGIGKGTAYEYFSSKEEIEVGQHGDDILVSMRNERRRFHIPETVRHRTLVDSEYNDGLLKVYLS